MPRPEKPPKLPSQQPYQTSSRKESLVLKSLPYLVITLLTILFNFPFVVPGMGNMQDGDFAMFYLPFRIYSSLQVHMGDWPFRANELMGGYPTWQDPQFSLLYPINLLFAVVFPNFATEAVIDLYMLVNLIVLSLSSVFFIRCIGISRVGAVAGACVISFTGFTVTHGQYLAMLQISSLSMVAGGFLIKYFYGNAGNFRLPLAAGVSLALGNLTGNPQPIVYFHYAIAAGVAILAAELWRRTRNFKAAVRMAIGGIAAFVVSFLLSAVHLVPTAHLIAISQRAEVTREAAIWTPLELQQLIMLVLPGFYQILPWKLNWPLYDVDQSLSFTNLVEGYIPLGFFAVSLGLLGWFHYRRSLLVQALGFGSLFLMACALGDFLPFYNLMYSVLPGISLLRVSARILLVFFPVWGVLVALGVQALWRNEPQVIRSGRYVITFLVLAIIAATLYAFRGHDNWLAAWVGIMAGFAQEYVTQYAHVFVPHLDEIKFGLALQIILGLFFLAATTILFVLPVKRLRARVVAIIALMFVEIFLYSFGWNMAINTPPLDDGFVKEYKYFPNEVEGRTIGLHYVFSGPINAPLYMDAPPQANAYSVTYDKWIGYFLPAAEPPWPVGVQKILSDLWNITDLAIPKRPVWAQVNGQQTIVNDWGWTELAQLPDPESGIEVNVRRAQMPTSFTMALSTDQPVKQLHVLASAGESAELEDGVEIGQVIATTITGKESTASIVLGTHVSESKYPDPGSTDGIRPEHTSAPIAYRRTHPQSPTNGTVLNDAAIDIATSEPLESLKFQVTAPYPATLAIGHAFAIQEDGTSVSLPAIETAGFKLSDSLGPDYYTLHRDYSTGFIRMMPRAIGGSYKDAEFIFWRVLNGKIDPMKTIVVDKRKLDDEALQNLNAPNLQSFDGKAEITWINDENATIQVDTNQRGWVMLSYAWDAGWDATLNGDPATIYRASGPFMAFAVPEGKSEIKMKYRPQGLLPGALISSISLIGVIAAWIIIGRRRRPAWRN